MKKIVLLLVGFFLLNQTRAQVVDDQVDLGAGYVNQVFYNLNTTQNTVAINTWDIGFSSAVMDASVISNANTITVYKISNADSNKYATITDTAGLALTVQYNSDTNWSKGAFNVNQDLTNPFDFGWGIYNTTSYNVYGDTLYIIQKGTDFYKFWIRVKNGLTNTNVIRYAKLDGSPDVDLTIPMSSYATKNFVYLNLDNPTPIDLEPASSDWHLLFTHYMTDIPGLGPYPVTGVLNNLIILPLSGPSGTEVAEASHVDVGAVSFTDYSTAYKTNISEIGYDWKYFDMNVFQYFLEDSLIYFVKIPGGSIYSLMFTGFDNTTGIIDFQTEQLLTGINDLNGDITQASVYPNPATDQTTVVYDAKKNTNVTAVLSDLTGREVMRNEFAAKGGLNSENVKLPKLAAGIYHLTLNAGEQHVSMKVVVSQ